MLLDLYYIIMSAVIMIVLLFIEAETVRTNKRRHMKHTVAQCEKAYIRGETSYTPSLASSSFTLQDMRYMNELWDHPERPLTGEQGPLIYWKRENM